MVFNKTISSPRPLPGAPSDYPRKLNLVDRSVFDEKATNLPQSSEQIQIKSEGPDRDERGFKVLKGAERFDVTIKPFSDDSTNDEGRKRSSRIAYIEGLRGILGFQTLLWIFFRLFAPAMVTDTDMDGMRPAPFTESITPFNNMRKVLSPILFNGSLQMTMFIILSGRVGLLTFIERREALTIAGPAFRRPFRLVFPAAIALALFSVVTALNGFKYAPYVAEQLKDEIAQPPKIWDSTLKYFNSMVAFFSPMPNKHSRAVAFIPPSGIAWFVEIVFQQTYVLIIYAWTLPYTIFQYKSWGLFLLISVTAWVGRWSWYTLTGLAIAEYSVVYRQMLPAVGLPIDCKGRRHIPTWLIPGALTLLGVFFKYLWIAILPHMQDAEIVAHANANTGKLNYGIDTQKLAYPRYDDWLVCTGLLILIELSSRAQSFLSCKPLVYLGLLSFSIALISGTVMLSLGSLIFHYLSASLGWTNTYTITGVLFCILVPLCLVCADIFS